MRGASDKYCTADQPCSSAKSNVTVQYTRRKCLSVMLGSSKRASPPHGDPGLFTAEEQETCRLRPPRAAGLEHLSACSMIPAERQGLSIDGLDGSIRRSRTRDRPQRRREPSHAQDHRLHPQFLERRGDWASP